MVIALQVREWRKGEEVKRSQMDSESRRDGRKGKYMTHQAVSNAQFIPITVHDLTFFFLSETFWKLAEQGL